MFKKVSLCIAIIAAMLLFTSFSFATNLGNEVQNSMEKTGNTVGNMVEGATNAGKEVVNNVGNAVSGTMNNIRDGFNTVTDDMNNNSATDDINDSTANNQNDTNNNYIATRTATFGAGTNNSTMWIWVVLGVVALLIIGLSWYYMSDNRNSHNDE